jgi:hypothetical protein
MRSVDFPGDPRRSVVSAPALIGEREALAFFLAAQRASVLAIEETARHAGRLDIARELIDGRTGLGPR